MEKDLMVKTLIKKGTGFIVESRKASEISTGFSLPVDSCTFEDSAVAVASKKIVKHEDMNWITKEQLWTEIQRINQKNMTTEMFATMIAPKVKKSVSPSEHLKWDLAHSYTRKLMKQLADEGKISWRKPKGTLHFVCNIKIHPIMKNFNKVGDFS